MTAPLTALLERVEADTKVAVACELVQARSVASGGFCPKFDGRYKLGRAIKTLVMAGYLEEARYRYRWTEAGRAALHALASRDAAGPADAEGVST